MTSSMTSANCVKFRDGKGPSPVGYYTPLHPLGNFLPWIAFVWLLFYGVSPRVQAYVFSSTPPTVWPNGTISMTLKLGPAGRTLLDGNTSWDTVAQQALGAWNTHLGTVQFMSTVQSPGLGADGDRVNQAFFDSTVYGQSFGSGTLAVTQYWYSGSKMVEGDVVFNAAEAWDSYRGPSRYLNGRSVFDLRRVAIHEFGHVLGLDHPDDAGQTVNAIMNSIISDLDSLASDDIQGAEALYSGQQLTITTQPQSQTANAGSTVTFSVAVTGSQPLSYQWYENNSPLAGATGAS